MPCSVLAVSVLASLNTLSISMFLMGSICNSLGLVYGSFCEFIVQGDRFLPTKNSNGILEITVAAICFN